MNNPAGSLWHSGMSPNRYEVVLLEPMVKRCYGCGSAFSGRFRSSPLNVILKHVDRRITGKNDTGSSSIVVTIQTRIIICRFT